jgi:hypothetical protein
VVISLDDISAAVSGSELSSQTRKAARFSSAQNHLADPERLSCLLLAAWLAYIGMVYQELLVIVEKKVGPIDCTERIDQSLFRLSLDWIHDPLKSCLDFTPIFRFQSSLLFPDVRQQKK